MFINLSRQLLITACFTQILLEAVGMAMLTYAVNIPVIVCLIAASTFASHSHFASKCVAVA